MNIAFKHVNQGIIYFKRVFLNSCNLNHMQTVAPGIFDMMLKPEPMVDVT